MEEKEMKKAEEGQIEVKQKPATKKRTSAKKPAVSPAEHAPTEERAEETPVQERIIVKLVPTETKCPEADEERLKKEEEAKFALKEKKPKAFSAYKHLKTLYSEDQALNLLRRKIFQYKEIAPEFLKKIEESNAYRMERVYIPVAKVSASVRYSWNTKGAGETFAHNEIKRVEKLYVDGEQGLNAMDFSTAALIGDAKKGDERLFGQKRYTLKKAKKQFNATLRGAKPNKKAKLQTCGESYELIYVPVLKATCYFEGEAYVGYVNLVNGACISEYKISDRLERAVDKTAAKVRSARQSMISSCFFLLALVLFAGFKAFYPDWSFKAVDMGVLFSGIWIAAFMAVPIFGLCTTLVYKRKTMKEKTVATGKLPHAYLAKTMVFFSWLSCAGGAVLFALKVLV